RVSAKVTSGTVLAAATDPDVTGSYVLRIGNVPPGAAPAATITVDGVDIRTGLPLTEGCACGPAGDGHWPWWVWLVLAVAGRLVLLFLLTLLRLLIPGFVPLFRTPVFRARR